MSDFDAAVRAIQFLSADAVQQANSGHPGTPMALAGIVTDLFTRTLRYHPSDPAWPNRDRFVLSCGHASMLLYSVLHLAGYPLSLDDLRAFRQWGSKTPGHPEVAHTPGVETTTGPLGQGIGNAVGMALASKLLAARVNEPGSTLIDYRVFAFASDGDVMEGVACEASSLAGHLGLDNLVVVYDDNKITIDGATDLSFSEDVGARYAAMGWFVQRVDGHAPEQVRAALDAAVAEPARPSLIIARTHIAIGAPTKQDTSAAHGAPLGEEELRRTKEAAGWDPQAAFVVPDAARALFAARAEALRPAYEAWKRLESGLAPERAARWAALRDTSVPADLYAQLRAGLREEAGATRVLAGKVLQLAARLVPSLVGGSADLAGSAMTTLEGSPAIQRGEFAGRNLHFGIREHGMGALMNGLALSGLVPFGSTFLVFSDYLRPSVRLAALMRQRAVYVFSHDSVFLGEDGPTHQPVEHLWSLRLIPNLDVLRPADALECAAAWAHALARKDGPSAMALSRQKLPVLRRPSGFDPEQILRGAYVLDDTPGADLVLIATGSEVHVAQAVKPLLEAQGRKVRVVSAPCWNAFRRLPAAEQAAVLGEGVQRVTLEAGVTEPWRAVVGDQGLSIGVDRFGASAPQERLADELGLSVARVAARILAGV